MKHDSITFDDLMLCHIRHVFAHENLYSFLFQALRLVAPMAPTYQANLRSLKILDEVLTRDFTTHVTLSRRNHSPIM